MCTRIYNVVFVVIWNRFLKLEEPRDIATHLRFLQSMFENAQVCYLYLYYIYMDRNVFIWSKNYSIIAIYSVKFIYLFLNMNIEQFFQKYFVCIIFVQTYGNRIVFLFYCIFSFFFYFFSKTKIWCVYASVVIISVNTLKVFVEFS